MIWEGTVPRTLWVTRHKVSWGRMDTLSHGLGFGGFRVSLGGGGGGRDALFE